MTFAARQLGFHICALQARIIRQCDEGELSKWLFSF